MTLHACTTDSASVSHTVSGFFIASRLAAMPLLHWVCNQTFGEANRNHGSVAVRLSLIFNLVLFGWRGCLTKNAFGRCSVLLQHVFMRKLSLQDALRAGNSLLLCFRCRDRACIGQRECRRAKCKQKNRSRNAAGVPRAGRADEQGRRARSSAHRAARPRQRSTR